MDRGADWWAQVRALTVAPPATGPSAHGSSCEDVAGHLLHLAAALARAAAVPGACSCGEEDVCAFAELRGGSAACALVPLLAIAGAQPSRRDAPQAPVEELRMAYLRALRDAAPAVSQCRRTQHISGRCWFGPNGWFTARNCADDICGRVLAAAHLLSDPAPQR